MKNYDWVREDLTDYFGSCPLTDEYIDSVFTTSYAAIDAFAECMSYMHNELGMPYTEWFQKIADEERRKWDGNNSNENM